MCMHAHMHACAYVDKDLFCNSPWAVLPVYIHSQVIHNIRTASLGEGNLRCLKKEGPLFCMLECGWFPSGRWNPLKSSPNHHSKSLLRFFHERLQSSLSAYLCMNFPQQKISANSRKAPVVFSTQRKNRREGFNY